MRKKRVKPLDWKLSIAALGVMLWAPAANADFTYGISLGVGQSDNITRVAEDEIDETIGAVGVELDWREDSNRLEADVGVDLSYFEYFDDTYDSEVVGTANGTVRFGIVPDRFKWMVQDSFGQAQSDPFAPITPDNREDLNYFSTGPELILPLGSAAILRAFGVFSDTAYEVSPLDSEQTTAGLAVIRQSSGNQEYGLNAVTRSVDFDDENAGDYDQDSAFFSYSVEGSRTDLSADIGYSWLRPATGEDGGGLLFNFTMRRELSAGSSLNLTLGRDFSDSGNSLRGALEEDAVGGPDVSASSDPFESRTVQLRWDFMRRRTGVNLGVGFTEDAYETQTQLDRKRLTYTAVVTRQMRPTIDFELAAALNDEEFANAGVTSDEFNLTARLNWRAGRTLTWSLSYEHADRSTSDGGTEFTENRAFVRVAFSPRGMPATRPRR